MEDGFQSGGWVPKTRRHWAQEQRENRGRGITGLRLGHWGPGRLQAQKEWPAASMKHGPGPILG